MSKMKVVIDCRLWTFDMPLKQGLASRGFVRFFEKS